MSWTLPQMLRATGAELVQWGPGPFRGVATDSRRIGPGEVFLALAGPNHDGHDFIDAAMAAGASGAIIAREIRPKARVAWLRVRDGLDALGDLAAVRRRGVAARVVGVTGSNGKTTTKDMIAAVLAASGRKVARSRGTENNLVGLPQTLLGLDGDEDFVVLEMGMNHPGEIWRLAGIAAPDVGVITNVGPAHLEGLGSLAGVAAAKAELALGLPSSSTLVVSGGDPWLERIAERFAGRTVRTGEAGAVWAIAAEPLGERGQRLRLAIEGREVTTEIRALGPHNVANALLAAAVGRVLGLAPETIARGLAAFEPPAMRLERLRLASGARILNDAYNANPASVAAALATLAGEPARRRIAVLGEMRELGPAAAEYHREVGVTAARTGVDRLVPVGPYARETAAAAIAAGLPAASVQACEGVDAAAALLAAELRDGDLVLVKGSRAARLEELVRRLEETR